MTLNLSAIGHVEGPYDHPYTWSDLALYAVALGAGPSQLDFLLEPTPKVLPTWGVIPAMKPVFVAFEKTGLNLLHQRPPNAAAPGGGRYQQQGDAAERRLLLEQWHGVPSSAAEDGAAFVSHQRRLAGLALYR